MLNRLKGHAKRGLAGIPMIMFRIWKKDYAKNIEPLTDGKLQQYIRGAFIAGRSQCPNGCKTFEESLILLDCNSMYPFVLGSFPYPSHKTIKLNDSDLGLNGGLRMGIYTCDIDQRNIVDMNIIPYPGKTYDWTNKSPQNNVILTSVDIGMIRRYNGTVNVKSGYPFETLPESPYRALIKEIATARQESTDESDRKLLKLAMNSLSGNIIRFEYTHHAAFMYSYARMWMYDIIYSQGSENIRYTDTDSALIKKDLYEKIEETEIYNFGPVIGDVIGQFKVETEVDKAELFNTKRYLLWNKGQIVRDHRQAKLTEK